MCSNHSILRPKTASYRRNQDVTAALLHAKADAMALTGSDAKHLTGGLDDDSCSVYEILCKFATFFAW